MPSTRFHLLEVDVHFNRCIVMRLPEDDGALNTFSSWFCLPLRYTDLAQVFAIVMEQRSEVDNRLSFVGVIEVDEANSISAWEELSQTPLININVSSDLSQVVKLIDFFYVILSHNEQCLSLFEVHLERNCLSEWVYPRAVTSEFNFTLVVPVHILIINCVHVIILVSSVS